MTRFTYQAYDSAGRLMSGSIESPSREEAFAALRRTGHVPLDITDAATERGPTETFDLYALWRGEGARLTPATRLLIVRELASLVTAGLAIDECLRIVAANRRLGASGRRVLDDVLARVEAGEGLSDALAAHQAAFPAEITRPILTAEASGALAPVLGRIADLLERRDAGARRLRSALTYPAFLLVAALATILVVTGALVPAIAPLFEGSGVAMPTVLATLKLLHDGVANHGWLLIAAVLLALAALASKPGASMVRRLVDNSLLRLPVTSRLIRDFETQRFAATLAMLLDGGVTQLEALRITSAVLATSVYRSAVDGFAEAIAEGRTLGDEMAKSGLFGDAAVRLVTVGERTGQLGGMLARLASLLDDAQRVEVERLLALIGPLLTVLIGLLVGGIVISIMSAVGALNELAFK